MRSGAVRLAALVITLATAAVSAPVAACDLEGGLGDSFGAAHPGSLEVAFAAHDAIKAGFLIPDFALAAPFAHLRGDGRLRMLAASLPVLDAAAPIAVLLIERGTWTRLTPKAGAWVVTAHADSPQAGEDTLIASELAVRDLANGRLTANEAIARGLLSVNGHAPLVAALTQAYPDTPPSVAQR